MVGSGLRSWFDKLTMSHGPSFDKRILSLSKGSG